MARDKRKTREDLFAAAVEEFRECGYFGTDTNRLARRGGYAPQTFYRHFRDKLEIFLAAYRHWGEQLWTGINEEFRSFGELDDVDSWEAVRDLSGRVIARVLGFHRDYYRLRGSFRALVVTEKDALVAQAEQRTWQLGGMAMLAERGPFVERTAEEQLSLLLELERVCDAIACGELAMVEGVDEEKMIEVLVTRLTFFLCGRLTDGGW